MTPTARRPLVPSPKYWTKQEYLELAELPRTDRARYFLLRGELLDMPAMGAEHALCLQSCTYWAVAAFRPKMHVRVQVPIDGFADSMPEPDLAIVSLQE